MPDATFKSHKYGTAVLDVAFNVDVDNYEFYSHEVGANVPNQMRKVATVANPGDTGGGRSEFSFADLELGITDPTRPWWIRVIAEDGGVRDSIYNVEGAEIAPSSAAPNSLYNVLASGNFDGTAGKGLFDFKQTKPITIHRIVGTLTTGFPYTISIKDADDVEQIIAEDTGAPTHFLLTQEIPLEVGDRILVKTTGAGGAFTAKVTKKPEA